MPINYNNYDEKTLCGAFLDIIETEEIEEFSVILDNPSLKKKINQHTLLVGLISSSSFTRLDTFYYLYEYLENDGYKFDLNFKEKLFNALCQCRSLDTLKILDKLYSLSEHMMVNSLTINDSEVFKTYESDFLQRLDNLKINETHEDEFNNSWNTHGFITSAELGDDDIVEYLLNKSVDISQKLIEAAFISACKSDCFDTAIILYTKIENLEKSQFINTFLEFYAKEEAKNFINKLILKEEIEKNLPKSESNNNKFKM